MKATIKIPTRAQLKAMTAAIPAGFVLPTTVEMGRSTAKAPTISKMNQSKRPRQPVHHFFQMLFGFSSINFYVVKTSKRPSVRGRGKNFGGSASRSSLEPINCANMSFCCRNSAMISGDGGEIFSATIPDLSRIEKSTAKMKIQIAARPAQAAGAGQKISFSRSFSMAANVNLRSDFVRQLASVAARISARHSIGTCRSDWRESFCSNSFI